MYVQHQRTTIWLQLHLYTKARQDLTYIFPTWSVSYGYRRMSQVSCAVTMPYNCLAFKGLPSKD
jgi:hypothetical protein